MGNTWRISGVGSPIAHLVNKAVLLKVQICLQPFHLQHPGLEGDGFWWEAVGWYWPLLERRLKWKSGSEKAVLFEGRLSCLA